MDKRVLDDQEKNEHPVCFSPSHGARMSLMTWGCITYEGLGTITIVNAPKYLDIIENNVWPIIARHFPNNDYIYQDDRLIVWNLARVSNISNSISEPMEFVKLNV